jgi:DNA-binding IclR family transcriptional regulator
VVQFELQIELFVDVIDDTRGARMPISLPTVIKIACSSALCATTGETVVLTETAPPESRLLIELMPDRELFASHNHSAMQRMHSSAHGKVSLSRIDELAIETIIGQTNLFKATDKTITDFAELLSELEEAGGCKTLDRCL